MKIVVDANVLIAALVSKGMTLNVLFAGKIEFIAPSFIFKEINNHWVEIVKKSGISQEGLKLEFDRSSRRLNHFLSVSMGNSWSMLCICQLTQMISISLL